MSRSSKVLPMLKTDVIAKLLEDGKRADNTDPLVITPCPITQELAVEGASSVDLRLGTWFVTLKNARMTHLGIGQFGYDQQLTNVEYVRFGRSYVLHPRSFVLSVTLEWLRLPGNLGAYVIGKSSWGRRGLVIATATSVHPGYKGCLTLELGNLGELPIEISPGTTICQLCLHHVETDDDPKSEANYVDKSQFVGSRKPSLGEIKIDDVAKKLADAYKLEPDSSSS